jgi:hypothetical protein
MHIVRLRGVLLAQDCRLVRELKLLPTDTRLLLSGTPIQNTLEVKTAHRATLDAAWRPAMAPQTPFHVTVAFCMV